MTLESPPAQEKQANGTVEQAAENIGKMGINAAMAMGNIVKTKIEEEIHKHSLGGEEGDVDERGASGTSSDGADAVGGEDIQEEEEGGGEEGTADESRILISKVKSHIFGLV